MQRRLFLSHLVAASLARPATDASQVWAEYLAWYRQQSISVSNTRKAYLKHLKQSGLSDTEVRQRSELIERLSRERREELRPIFFDRTYVSAPRFNTEPNALLVEAVRERKPGRALDVHMGQGRNSIFLALEGWEVTGFDFSAEGVRAAREAAKRAGVAMTALVNRHEDFDFGQARWDLVVMSYTWVPLRSPFVQRIVESLRPGGLLVFEHMMDLSGSDGAAEWLPGPNELLHTFGALRIIRYEDVRARADWSWRPERIARLIAEK